MEKIYLLLIILVFGLTVSDLIFNAGIEGLKSLGSVFPSKMIQGRLLLLLAGAGILLGVLVSEEMMHVSRDGIFYSDYFGFAEILFIFFSVIISKLLLTEIFRTLGIQPATTVTVIFSLCGASLTAIILKTGSAVFASDYSHYLNTDKILAITGGFLLSIGFAFIAGYLLQWLIRFFFTFNFGRTYAVYGGLYAGFLFTLIAAVILSVLVKSTFLPQDMIGLLERGRKYILLAVFIICFFYFQIFLLVSGKFDLNGVLGLGVFSLAFAFAGNDLSNFLGIPAAVYNSFESEMSGANVLNHASPFGISVLLLFGAAVFAGMIIYRNISGFNIVKEDTSRSPEAQSAYPVSRSIVRGALVLNKKISHLINLGIKNLVNKRFHLNGESADSDKYSFDKLRASNILLISSLLVIAGTNLKIPLSTAYIVFMVTLGASLGDRLWNRESAVGGISGIFSLIGSWFFNSFFAFIFSSIIVFTLFKGGNITALVLGILTFILIFRSNIGKKKAEAAVPEVDEFPESTVRAESVLVKTNQDTSNAIIMISKAFFLGLNGFNQEDRKQLGEIDAEIEEFNQRIRKLKANIFRIIQKLQQDSIETGHYYVQIIDYLREMAHSIKFIVRPLYEHLGGNHKPFSEEQNEDLIRLSTQINDFLNYSLHIIKESKFDQIEELIIKRQDIKELMQDLERKQIRRIRRKETSSRNSVLFFTLMSESKNLLLQTVNLLKATRDFVSYTKQ